MLHRKLQVAAQNKTTEWSSPLKSSVEHCHVQCTVVEESWPASFALSDRQLTRPYNDHFKSFRFYPIQISQHLTGYNHQCSHTQYQMSFVLGRHFGTFKWRHLSTDYRIHCTLRYQVWFSGLPIEWCPSSRIRFLRFFFENPKNATFYVLFEVAFQKKT